MDNYTIKPIFANLRIAMNNMNMSELMALTIEQFMLIERKEYLEKIENDKGNGFYTRLFNNLSKNSILVEVPRTRTGNFKPESLELINIGQKQINDLSLFLYRKGMTSRDVEDVINRFFDSKLSHSKVSYLAKEFNKIRKAWLNSDLEEEYLVVYCDCTYITVRRGDKYKSEPVYIAYGVRKDLRREVISLDINPTETAEYWKDLFKDMKRRGVKKVGLFVTDGLPGIKEAILENFDTVHQSCVIHKMRNILKRVRSDDKKEVGEDLKKLFNNFGEGSTKAKALKKLDDFINKWAGKYSFKRYFKEDDIDSLFRYIDFDYRVRRMIYTNNGIENLNKIIKKGTKNKLSFKSSERLLDYVFIIIKDFEDRSWMKYPVSNFKHFRKTRHN